MTREECIRAITAAIESGQETPLSRRAAQDALEALLGCAACYYAMINQLPPEFSEIATAAIQGMHEWKQAFVKRN